MMMAHMKPQTSTSTCGSPRLRKAMREKIYAIILKKLSAVPPAASHVIWDEMLSRLTDTINDKLWMSAKSSEKLYTDLGDLEARVLYFINEFTRKCYLQQKHKQRQQQQKQQQLQQHQRHVCPPTSLGMISVSSSHPPPLDPIFTTPHYKNDFATGGFPATCGDSNLSGFSRAHPLYGHSHQQTAVANYHMVDVSRPQLTPGFCTPPSATGFGICTTTVPPPLACRTRTSQELLSSTPFPTLSIPFGSYNLYGVVTPSCSMALAPDTVPLHSNPMLTADATFTSNHSNLQGMQQTPYLHHQLGNTSFQSASTNNFPQLRQPLFNPVIHQQARDIQHQGQHSQPLYPAQLQNQDHLPYQGAYRTQLPTGLATPVNRGPSLDFYKEALEQQTSTGFKPSNLQFQQNAFNGAQSTSVHTSLLSSSPSLPPHPRDQKQSASVLVQRQSPQQKSTQISENNNGERQHIWVNSCQKTPMQPEPVHSCSSARSPKISENNNGERELIGVNLCQTTPMQPEPVHSCSSARSPKISENNNGERELIGVNLCQTTPMQPESLHRCSSARAPQISANNHGERELIGVNLCQTTSMQPEPVHRCSSERAPITISGQTVFPRSTAKRSRLCLEHRSIGDRSREYRNQIRWILFLLHARGCSATGDNCLTKFCRPAKKLLEHIKRCKIPDCAEPRCSKTRALGLHYKDCRDKSCPVCVSVKNFIKKQKERDAETSLKCRPRESSESVEAYNKGGAEAISVDDDLQPSVKRLKIERTSQNASPGGVCNSYASMPKQERNGLQSDDCKSVRVEVILMDTDVSEIPVTRELEKHVAEDIPKGKDGGESATDEKTISLSSQGKSKCMNEMSAPKEEKVKQPVDFVDASKMEISTLVELFTPEQAKEHIRGLRQWVGQSKTKADKNKAMGCSISASACQLCALESLLFAPLPIYCSPCGVRIKRNVLHYSAAAGESRHYVCATCYNEARGNSVSVDGTSIPKARLEKKKNDEQGEEAWVQCDKCQLWQHQICALFNKRRNHGESTKYTCPHCYIQEVEHGERRPLPQSTIPGAKSLPVTTLSNHIEERLFKNLKKERQERARLQGKSYEEVPGAESLAVRVVASVDKVLAVKERFLELFREENYPSEFPYKSKVILLFQKIESVEVCLFGMFVQEFGTESGPPDQRRVYLSYLDSVKYFRPEVRTVSGEALRTFVYHEILIGYLDYCKKRGFTSCYIWACPPLKGEDYILNCHPEIQKTPKTDKLREWYLAMLRKASEEDVVVECTNLYDQFFVQSGECRANVTAARLPYFDGDYWPGAAEDLIQQMSQEGDGTTKLHRKGLTKKVISKRALRAVGQLELSVNASKDRLMMQKLGEIICPMKEDFIMVHLQHCCKHCCTLMVSGNRWVCNHCKNFQICDNCYEVEQKRAEKERHPINQKEKHALFPVAIKDVPVEIEDNDDNIESEFFDTRQAFLSLCQGNNYQYDTLRRAKHSSMMILYHLHNPSAPAFATICTICQQEVENAQGWRCQVCTGYDVCNACYPKASLNHSHKLISRSSATETSVQHNGQANQVQLDKLRELLIHVTTPCRSTVCQYEGCRGMKRLIKHCVKCKISPRDCPDCIKFWRFIRIHAGSCRDSQCHVPKCRDYKAATSRQQQQSEKRRRAAVMEMIRKRAAEATHTS